MADFAKSIDLCRETIMIWKANPHKSSLQLVGHWAWCLYTQLPLLLCQWSSLLLCNPGRPGFQSSISGRPSIFQDLPWPSFLMGFTWMMNTPIPNISEQTRSANANRSPSLMCMETHWREGNLIILSLGHDLQIAASYPTLLRWYTTDCFGHWSYHWLAWPTLQEMMPCTIWSCLFKMKQMTQ